MFARPNLDRDVGRLDVSTFFASFLFLLLFLSASAMSLSFPHFTSVTFCCSCYTRLLGRLYQMIWLTIWPAICAIKWRQCAVEAKIRVLSRTIYKSTAAALRTRGLMERTFRQTKVKSESTELEIWIWKSCLKWKPAMSIALEKQMKNCPWEFGGGVLNESRIFFSSSASLFFLYSCQWRQ